MYHLSILKIRITHLIELVRIDLVEFTITTAYLFESICLNPTFYFE